MAEKVNGWPRELDRGGCLFGQHISEKVETVCDTVESLRKTLVALVISLATTSILLGINLVVGYFTKTP